MDLTKFKETFDELLEVYVKDKIEDAQNLLDDKRLNKMIEYVHTFMFSGGKRIRPYVLYLTYKGLGGEKDDAIFRFGIVFELLHSMALIHDDIIDKSQRRHNVSTIHYFIYKLLRKKNLHIAQSQALLIGDLLLSWVYELWYQNHDFDDKLLYNARKNVHRMIEEVILGQMIDVDMMLLEPTTGKMIEKKNQYKTASYTFTRPMLTGAILAGVDKSILENIRALGDYLGMAFQVRDDLKDILATEIDKRIFSDIQEGQQTFFTQYVFENGSDKDIRLLKRSLGKNLSGYRIKKLQNMFQKTGAIDFGKDLIKKYADESQHILSKIQFSDQNYKMFFESLINKLSSLAI
ncbi:polyprenyl synthetase family protein [Candidatus Gracilibacteria bacterium]|nr:polyprenyl synthetase family protein [Candidatus Gracilibacteria bacterium]